jgi:ATP-binding cassette subfamily B protein
MVQFSIGRRTRLDNSKTPPTTDRFATLRRYWRLLERYLRPEWARMALLALTLFGSIAVQVVTPLVAREFIDEATAGAALRTLLTLALVTMALALVGQALAVAETWVAEHVSWAATNALRADLVAHVLRLDREFHTRHTPGELIERVDGDVSALARFFSRFIVYVLGNALLILAILVLLFVIDWRIGLGLSLFVLLGLLAMLAIRARATPAWAAERQASAEFYGFLGEYLAGTEDIRANGAGPFVLRRFAEMMRPWFAATFRAGMWGYAIMATSNGLIVLGTATAFALSAALYRDGTLTIGTVYLIVQYTAILRQPIDQLRNEIQDLQQAAASLGRVEGLLDATPSLIDGAVEALPQGPLAVEFERVHFSYSGDMPALHDVSFRLEPGRVLGVVGRTGSGKTTLTRLLPRFYDPLDGVVRLGGVDLRTVRLAAVRERIGLVTQDIHLFNASVRDNVTLFDDGVPDADLRAALEGVGLGDWLRSLPGGLDTPLGAGGIGLSAGQAQVLACARVFLRDPDIVILDEASSRLDPATERLVQTALTRLLAGRTGIIVAHRLATLAFADDILVLEDGRICEYGPRLALVADPGSRFATLLRTASEEVLA